MIVVVAHLPVIELLLTSYFNQNLPLQRKVKSINLNTSKVDKQFVHFSTSNLNYPIVTDSVFNLSAKTACIIHLFETCQGSGSQTEGKLSFSKDRYMNTWVYSPLLTEKFSTCKSVEIDNNITIDDSLFRQGQGNFHILNFKNTSIQMLKKSPYHKISRIHDYYNYVSNVKPNKLQLKSRYSMLLHFTKGLVYSFLFLVDCFTNCPMFRDTGVSENHEVCQFGDLRFRIYFINSSSLTGIGYKDGNVIKGSLGRITNGIQGLSSMYHDYDLYQIIYALRIGIFVLVFEALISIDDEKKRLNSTIDFITALYTFKCLAFNSKYFNQVHCQIYLVFYFIYLFKFRN
ncbi:hypothetical protein TVAG_118160 [Trichomonas vaginalis G3]|uniref:Uncharacterized protein n=1 Tax=Trichomonas vaginalis (strain ATCC PRA-98 / G3) TaxID=412133 RepID=A2EI03_TRIV3|nr:hypothetical protein TVAGG3_0230300 [Trichomonas vaginalis G3]EAY07735.1 hypothetical protein TVAG_118160 [Trichomonas vaginalis G3]KAI5552578.1 hypothetical protein TVAGG3_0230300 [Trichomonas vaginalis G3]|eukprot:XP_001319958.1 hypothetical protein [Trichomonas vaginalis G3]